LPGAAKRVVASPDGGLLAIVLRDSSVVQLWRTDGTLERSFGGGAQPINALRFSHDGARLVTAQDNTVRVWDVAGAPLGTLNLPQPATTIALVAGDSQVAVASSDNAIRLYALPPGPDAVTGEPVATWEGHAQPVVALTTASADGNQVLSGSADGTMRLWQIGAGQQRQFDHGGPVTAVAARPDGARFASTGPNGVVKLWNAADGAMIAELKGDLHADLLVKSRERELTLAKGRVTDRQNALNAANELIKSETEAQKRVVEEQTKAQQARDTSATAATAAQEAQAAADKLVAEAMAALAKAQESRAAVDSLLAEAQKSSQKVAEAVAVAEAARVAAPDVAELQAAKVAAESLLAQAHQLEAAIEASKAPLDQGVAGTQTRVNQLAEDAKTKTKAAQDAFAAAQAAETALTAAMKSVEASNGSLAKAQAAAPLAEQQIATAQEGATAAEAALEAARQAAAAKQLPFTSVAFSPDNALVVAAGEDHVIHAWSAETGAPCDTYSGHAGAVADLAFIGDSRLASVAADDPRWLFWDLFPAWTLERTISGPDKFVDRVLALDFSSDGALLASGGGEPSRGGELKLWNVADGAFVREVPDAHSDTVFCVRFSPDGQQVASCGADKFVKVFNVADGAWVRSFEGHTHHVLGLAWRADGKVIASASADNSIKVWDAQNGDQLRTIGGFGKEVTSIEFIAEGPEILASSGDRTVRWFNTGDGANSRNFGGGGDFMYTAAAVPDGSLVVAGGQDSVLRLWKGADAAEVRQFAPPEAGK
jgi:WD40 repeat protein